MKKFYFTCGQSHRHIIDAKRVWDKDSVISVSASNEDAAREFVFTKFGDKWSFVYTEDEINMNYFPRGVIAEFTSNEKQPA